MSDPLSITAGIIAIVTATIQSTTALYNTIESFKTYPKRVGELKAQLSALSDVLRSLQELTEQDETVCALLETPLRQCRIACQDFKIILEECRRNSRSGKPSFSEWMRLRYRNGDIVSFIESLAMYKSTIGIAIADANLRTSKVTLRVLNEYKAEVDTTSTNLQRHVEELVGRLEGLVTPPDEVAARPSTNLTHLIQEKDSIEKCLQICRQFQADLDQMQFQLASQSGSSGPASRSSIGLDQNMTLASIITLSSLKACGLEMEDAVSKLSLHQVKAQERLSVEPTASPEDQTQTHALEVERLRSELESVNQLLSFCRDASSRATRERVHVIEDIVAGDNSQQVCVSTVGDLFKVKGARAGHGSFQFFGTIDAGPLQDIMRMHTQRHASNTAEEETEIHSISSISHRPTR